MRSSLFFCLSLISLCLVPLVSAQPSGGPYGPIEQRYEIPQAAHVYFVAPSGKSNAVGTSLDSPTTIESALERVVTGDAIVLRGGVYRTGDLLLNQGITIQPYAEEKPVLKGTEVATQWDALPNNVWRTPWSHLLPAQPLPWWQRRHEGIKTPLHRFNNDMVFIDGELLTSKGWEGELDAHSFYVDYKNGFVYIGADPNGHQVEITTHESGLLRTTAPAHGKVSDGKGPVIRGITLTQYGFRAIEIEGKKHFTPADEPTNDPVGISDPATYGKEVTNTLLENVTISYSSHVGGYFRGDGLIIRNCLVSDTSTEGIYVIGSSDVLLERNIIQRNNIKQLTGYFASAVKIFNQTWRVTFRDNLILDQPNSNGIWYDVGNRDAVIVNNYVEGAQDGIMIEISRGATIAGNVVVNSGDGLDVLNSADVRAYNNTFVNSRVVFQRNGRVPSGDLFDWHSATGPGVDQREGHVFVHNVMASTDAAHDTMLVFSQDKGLCEKLPNPMAKEVDGNVYVRSLPVVGSAAPLILYGPAKGAECAAQAGSVADFRKLMPEFEKNGVQIDKSARSVLKGPDFKNYALQHSISGAATGDFLPKDVRTLLGWSEKDAKTPGAYPVR